MFPNVSKPSSPRAAYIPASALCRSSEGLVARERERAEYGVDGLRLLVLRLEMVRLGLGDESVGPGVPPKLETGVGACGANGLFEL